ncbi:Flp1 family type IVb pilin [Faecalicatena contorta]|uniref:Flagellin, Flp1-like, domain n=1 Tax=Faecalicatena contorta TaxID=39482 RepID=A0A315ZUC2_9FIRM|nr:Flp1 family type IVb pilin [Faecalicatena contorta]PWJ49095.1 putative flagellin with Flp1-like domain [Faecalicatena contorta]SUQ14800.1 Putative Flagellin, Flp1-like, domain [Faecalicatena contorta]
MKSLRNKIRQKWIFIRNLLEDDAGLSVVEMILILVVIIALILIFKTQLISLVNSIFEKITSESAGI